MALETLISIIKKDQVKALTEKGYQVTPEIESKIEQAVKAIISSALDEPVFGRSI
jgi:hypothetical protein